MTRGAAALLAAMTGCSDGSGPAVCADLPVTVGAGTTPLFSWAEACPAYGMEVTGESGFLWRISGGDILEDIIPSPQRYGTVPPGVVVEVPPQPLQAGVTYTLVLSRRNRIGGGNNSWGS